MAVAIGSRLRFTRGAHVGGCGGLRRGGIEEKQVGGESN
jgi:hypothetical protein